MTILYWHKPTKVIPTEEWQSISADGAPPGVYTPNMSEEDQQRWKAKLCGQKSKDLSELRVEIRVSRSANILIKVYRGGIIASANGPFVFNDDDLRDFNLAIREAKQKLEEYVCMKFMES